MNRKTNVAVSADELARQREYTEHLREWNDQFKKTSGRSRKVHIHTYGCQMNVHDSEKLLGMLLQMGFEQVHSDEEADLILFNTCCVREHAETRVYGNVGHLGKIKRQKPELMIGVCGCMMQQEEIAKELFKKFPFVDLIFGTHALHAFPELLYQAAVSGMRSFDIRQSEGTIVEEIPVCREKSASAFVTIMYGCNNFCSYCIVPYVRGRERSREPEAIIAEAVRLMDAGAQEITLLGQNVNSYRGGGAEFAELLYRLDRLGVPRIRFMTSHPKDLSDELIHAYGELKHLMPHLHLPVQAGNNEILDRMNRRYTREHYLDLVSRLRKARPEIGITTDIIVGFPGETLEQFEDTLSLVEEVRYDSAYTFIYSPRKGTKAASMPDGTSAEVKSERIQRLINLQQSISAEILEAQVGKKEIVLVESLSARDAGSVGGKTPRSHMVNFPGNADMIGKFVEVEITSAGRNTLRGRII